MKPYLVPLLPTFHGMENENPYNHIRDFKEVCTTFKEGCHRHGATKAKSLSTDPKGQGKNLTKCIKAKNHKELGRAAGRVSKIIL